MEDEKFFIVSIFDKGDYKQYMYITYFRNKGLLFLTVLLAFLCSVYSNWKSDDLHLWTILNSWLFFTIFIVLGFCLYLESIYKRRIDTDTIGLFGSVRLLKFYDDKVEMLGEALNSRLEINYDQFYSVRESKYYYMFYLSPYQVVLIPKRDIDQLDEFKKFIVEKLEKRYKYI
ncbi:YcxB family protein [Anaerotignum sp. MB30-C6]|uniref:YcxB family protein n=1 Tax=Anaerotignum sp. MB30-C6 TaxID=3070814 RepID=UPI0027DC541F|nr:YcxB family protein [Anaerotignum sp. MB30-C6]WMI81757.1 YcxB family protein [Anaerotignum sp. MB30-C6]